MKKIIITHLWVIGFGWENTIYSTEDFNNVMELNKIDNKFYEFEATQGGKSYLLKGYYVKDDEIVDTQYEYTKELNNERICDQCGSEMKELKKPRKKYGKHNTIYKCTYCDHTHRKRTQNEILRDKGLRE